MNKIKALIATAAVLLMASMAYSDLAPAASGKSTTKKNTATTRTFIDENGDGICDNWANRPRDGSGNQYRRGGNRGSGGGQFGSGVCDGTGPHGQGRRSGNGSRRRG